MQFDMKDSTRKIITICLVFSLLLVLYATIDTWFQISTFIKPY